MPKLGSRRKNKPKIEIIPGSLIQRTFNEVSKTTVTTEQKSQVRPTTSVEDLTNSADSSPLVVVKKRKRGENQELLLFLTESK